MKSNYDSKMPKKYLQLVPGKKYSHDVTVLTKYISRAPKEPLIRIRLQINHSRFNSFHVATFAKPYKGRIANTDIILFKKMSKSNRGKF